jgi:tetraacyldisaccharide 4'-kinase
LKILTSIFGSVVQARNALYDRGVLPVRKLQGPVISVGNLSVGGSGKTPFVILLGEFLRSRAIQFDVLSRGYGRQTRNIALVDATGSAREFGDEPLLIARRLGVPVVVGANRYQAGVFAEKKFGPQWHILDDGFQHRGLARTVDLVLVGPEDAQDTLLPTGRLREPLGSLERADAVVFTNRVHRVADPLSVLELLGKPAWHIRRGILVNDIAAKPVAFCGIAKPENFVSQLRAAGIEPAAEKFYRDHHAYAEQDIKNLLQIRDRSGADGFVTTEKDAVNLGQRFSDLQPLAVVSVTMELENADNALDTMLRMIEERKQGA